MIRVMIVDGNEFPRLGLKLSLENEEDIEVVRHYGDAASAITEAGAINPRIVLLNVNMPDMNSFEACRRIVDAAPDARVILMSPELVHEHIVTAMKAGSMGYLLKDTPWSDVVMTIRANAVGALYIIPPVAAISLCSMRFNKEVMNMGGLTRRERQVLILVDDGQTNQEIGAKLGISPNSVRNHIRHIFTKLNPTKRADLRDHASLARILDDTWDE